MIICASAWIVAARSSPAEGAAKLDELALLLRPATRL
jgi:hypothetical protein